MTVPTAPLLNVTVLLEVVVLKACPAIVIVEAFAASPEVLVVTTGWTAAICKAVPLLTLLVVTTAAKLPATVGLVLNVTVRDVAEAVVTEPTAPLFITTVLLEAVTPLKPKPLIVTVVAFAAMDVVLVVTTGVTVATCTADPLATLLVVTTAVRLPAESGPVVMLIVNDVAVAAVTVPAALLLKTIVLLPAVVLKPNPLIVSVVALAAKATVRLVTTGITVATFTAAALLTLLLET